MMHRIISSTAVLLPAIARAESDAGANWHAHSLGEALLYMGLFAVVGVALAIIGYKLFDYFTPGDLRKEIIEHRNVAAALVGGAVIIGTCIMVAAAMIS